MKCYDCKRSFNGDKLLRRIHENLKERQKRLKNQGKPFGNKIPIPQSKRPRPDEGAFCRDCLMDRVEEIKSLENK